MPTAQSGLAVVQDLYVLQVELFRYLKSDLKDPSERREAKKQVKQFAKLIKEADWQYMGGEDVLDTLKLMQKEVSRKLLRASGVKKTKAPVAKAAVKKPAKTAKKTSSGRKKK